MDPPHHFAYLTYSIIDGSLLSSLHDDHVVQMKIKFGLMIAVKQQIAFLYIFNKIIGYFKSTASPNK